MSLWYYFLAPIVYTTGFLFPWVVFIGIMWYKDRPRKIPHKEPTERYRA